MHIIISVKTMRIIILVCGFISASGPNDFLVLFAPQFSLPYTWQLL